MRYLPPNPNRQLDVPLEWLLHHRRRGEVATRLSGLLADAPDGITTRVRLRAQGLTHRQIDLLITRGVLLPVHRGVFAVGHLPRSFRAQWRAALVACGDAAALSHATAAAVAAMLNPHHRVHVTTPSRRERAGIAVHRATVDVVEIHGFACTTPARTLVDLAGSVPRDVLAAALRQSQMRDLCTVREIADVLLTYPRPRGARTLRALLDDPVELAPTRSAPERAALRMVLREGLPWPVVNGRVEDLEVDLHWRAPRVVLEVDGPDHLLGIQRERDRVRDEHLGGLGWTVLRVPHDRVPGIAGRLREALAA